MIRPTDFLTLADTLAQGSGEAEWRTAVSRGYYAGFLAARELLSGMGFQVPRAGRAHGHLWMRLANSGDPVISQAGQDLNDLQGERNHADYDSHLNLPQVRALRCVQSARLVLQRLAAAAVEPTRSQVRDAMRDYERDVLKDVTYQGP